MKVKEGAEDIVEGIEMISKQFCEILGKSGVTAIKSVGEHFDPYLHEAIMQINSQQCANNIIIEEFKKGYKLHDKVIRPSVVKVAKTD